jgi:hypothetical protein
VLPDLTLTQSSLQHMKPAAVKPVANTLLYTTLMYPTLAMLCGSQQSRNTTFTLTVLQMNNKEKCGKSLAKTCCVCWPSPHDAAWPAIDSLSPTLLASVPLLPTYRTAVHHQNSCRLIAHSNI